MFIFLFKAIKRIFSNCCDQWIGKLCVRGVPASCPVFSWGEEGPAGMILVYLFICRGTALQTLKERQKMMTSTGASSFFSFCNNLGPMPSGPAADAVFRFLIVFFTLLSVIFTFAIIPASMSAAVGMFLVSSRVKTDPKKVFSSSATVSFFSFFGGPMPLPWWELRWAVLTAWNDRGCCSQLSYELLAIPTVRSGSEFPFDPDPVPDTYPDWLQNDADPAPSFAHVGKYEIFFTFSHSIASSQCLNFLISVKGVTVFSLLSIALRIFLRKIKVYQLLLLDEM